jgi:assimilatory nitrate reductase catalytic subunit
METSVPSPVSTTCPYCGVGCGVLATATPETVLIQGDPEHPANQGRLCSKGSALGETLGLDGRLLAPRITSPREGQARDASWDEALDLVASRFSATLAEHGPESVAFYVSGQILTEDYYVANKLMKGFIGSANIDTNSRLCMASSVSGHRRAFGEDIVPGTYADLEQADVVVLVGSNLAWCHPVLYQRLQAARVRRGIRVIIVDPRRTATAEESDLHLPIAPDGDVALFLGLLRHLDEAGHADFAYCGAHVGGVTQALAAARAADPEVVAASTGLPRLELERFFALWAGAERVVTVYSQGVNQSGIGTDKVSAIINCHLLTGRIGRPGMGPFSVTGQPNAMGGREVGGLATMLAAHMEVQNPADRERVQRFWNSPAIAQRPGLKAVDMFEAVADGRIKALWIVGTSPVDSLPDADAARAALAACPFVVVSEVEERTDTTPFAHVLLPALAWGEKSGTVTNSERRISRQRSFLPAPGETRPDWWMMTEVARRMGYGEAFPYRSAAEIYREHAALSAFENDGRRGFDIGSHAAITSAAYECLTPFQWPHRVGDAGGDTRYFAEGGFFTPDRKARMVAVALPATQDGDVGTLVLNTGRIRDQWHTMTRTGRSARLMGQFGEPFCEIHPRDAHALGIVPASLVSVTARGRRAVLRALVTDRQRPGSLFVPMHWTDRFAAAGRVNALVGRERDPHSGQPALKSARVEAGPFRAAWYGFAVLAGRPEGLDLPYWALARAERGWTLECAGDTSRDDWQGMAAAMLGPAGEDAEWLAFHDTARGLHRLAALHGNRLLGAFFFGREPVALSRGFLNAQLGRDLDTHERLRLLAGWGGEGQLDDGPAICACFGVGVAAVVAAVRAGAADVEAIGKALRAGTNCGSCRSDLRRIIDAQRLEKAG